MYRRPFLKSPLSYCASIVSGWWYDARLFWYTLDKGPWIFGAIVLLVVSTFGYLANAAFEHKDETEEMICLALNVYFEARGEPREGQLAVAEVTMNRVASPRYPSSICGVVHQKNWDRLRKRYVGAFSWTEFDVKTMPRGKAWERAWEAAEAVYYRRYTPRLDGALHYHAVHIEPSWARGQQPITRIGRHVFYR